MLSVFSKLLRRWLRVAVFLHLSAAASMLAAQRLSSPALDPRTDVSASGTYALQVEPSSPRGRGAARYRLEHEGKEVWSAELPFTLWESVVGDDGSVAGYAYGNGIDGGSGVRGDHSDGDFRVVILDPTGSARLNVATERASSRFLHMLPPPVAAGLLLDPDNDRFVVRVEDEDVNRQKEEWWPFRLSTGEALPKFRPGEHRADHGPARSIIRTRHVKQSPLSLLHWWTFNRLNSDRWTVGASFTLVDLDGSPVWTLDLPTDYMLPGDEDGEDRLQDEIRKSGAILECTEPGRFEVGLVAERKRVTFEATPDATAKHHWKVVEVGRADWSREPSPATSDAVTEGHLEQVGTLELGGPAAPAPPLGRSFHFDIDDRGRFGFTREDGDKGVSLHLVSPEGLALTDIPLDLGAAGAGRSVAVAWITKDRWLLFVSWSEGDNENPAWWLDVGTKRLEPIAGLKLPAIRSIDGDGQGGFVALVNKEFKHTSEDSVVAVDATGRTRWTLSRGSLLDETYPFSAEAIAVASDGRVGVLDNGRNVVFVCARDGSLAQTIDLEEHWGWKPDYPSGLAADASGGWIVHDFHLGGGISLVRMSPAGEVVARLVPAFPDGRKLDPIGRVVAALDGGLWTTDQHALLHVNGQGVVDRMAGSAPDADRLDSITAVVADPQGRILVGDGRTGAVHVFDAEGRKLFVCRPAPQDEQGCSQIAAAADGRIFAGGGKGFVCFSAHGERTGTTDKLLNPAGKLYSFLGEQWLFQPKAGKRWAKDFSGIALVDADSKVVRKLEKRPDGTWLARPGETSMAPDGSLAVISDDINVCLFGPDGEPRQTIALPESTRYARLAFDGKRILLATQEAVFARDLGTKAWKRYPFASKTGGFHAVFLAPDGERIRLVPYESSQVIEFHLSD